MKHYHQKTTTKSILPPKIDQKKPSLDLSTTAMQPTRSRSKTKLSGTGASEHLRRQIATPWLLNEGNHNLLPASAQLKKTEQPALLQSGAQTPSEHQSRNRHHTNLRVYLFDCCQPLGRCLSILQAFQNAMLIPCLRHNQLYSLCDAILGGGPADLSRPLFHLCFPS